MSESKDDKPKSFRERSKQACLKRIRTIKTVVNLLVLILLCHLQAMWPMATMPQVVDALLWAAYAAQLLILSNRLFGIRLPLLISAMTLLSSIGTSIMQSKRKHKAEKNDKVD